VLTPSQELDGLPPQPSRNPLRWPVFPIMEPTLRTVSTLTAAEVRASRIIMSPRSGIRSESDREAQGSGPPRCYLLPGLLSTKRFMEKGDHLMVGGSCPSRSRESPNGAIRSRAITASAWRSHIRSGELVGRLHRPSGELSLRFASHGARHGAGCSISRSERPSGRGRSQTGASFGSITIRSPGSFAPLARFASFK